ncbi:hypothetical protein [Rhodococcus tukisamuensis]|uniref:Pullulanase n=1 Tax=Rhodococcus tukisamuensis TaxID=168276 RepID=A0A1G7DXT6_9NOCA|nr:hypothetical protein [Rhodococcus tukisamuensis]SDE56162.1 hypothetical protein SAMN05444580_12140 [Rhodococcus tukisamuensis]
MGFVVEYAFGTGDGDQSVWESVADLGIGADDATDAVRLDFDGDGLLDDAMWDSDGDGRADRSVLDVDGPGTRYFTDPSGLGTWDHEVPGPAHEQETEPAGWSWGPDPHSVLVDEDGDGTPEVAVSDTDGDGRLDAVRRHPSRPGD